MTNSKEQQTDMSIKLVDKSSNQAFEIIEEESTFRTLWTSPEKTGSDYTSVDVNKLEHFKEKIVVVDSVYSGLGRDQRKNIYTQVINPVFKKLGIKHEYVKTENENSVRNYAKSIEPTGNTTILFLSGDTTVSEFVNGLKEAGSTASSDRICNVTILALPHGTGNSLALSLGYESKLDAFKRFFTGIHIPLNLYKTELPSGSCLLRNEIRSEIDTRVYFIVVFSWAFHAAIVADSDTAELRKLGSERFKVAAMKNLESQQSYEGSTYIGSERVEGPFCYWLVTGAKRFEPTFDILPQGNIEDESLYLIAIAAEHGHSLLEIMYEVYDKGKHTEDNRVLYKKIDKGQYVELNVGITSKKRLCLDGSIIALPDNKESRIGIESIGNEKGCWRIYACR